MSDSSLPIPSASEPQATLQASTATGQMRLLTFAADILVIGLCLGFLAQLWLTPVTSNKPASQKTRLSYAPGETFGLPGVDVGTTDQTLVIAISNTCSFCDKSMPLYKRIIESRSPANLKVVVVGPQDPAAIKDHLRQFGVDADQVLSAPLESMKLTGTPTLILLGRSREIRRIWIGQLDSRSEADLVETLAGRQVGD